MARISKYQFDQDITGNDFVIGSDSVTKKTRNFKFEDIVAFLSKQEEILGDKFVYIYDRITAYDGLPAGRMSFNNKSITDTPFSGITTIYLNRYNTNNQDVYDYLVKLQDKGGILNLHNIKDATSFGAFRIQAINLSQNDVITLTVDLLAGGGTILGDQSIAAVGEFNSGDKTYIHTQIASSSTWVVDHALNKFPSVTVVDTGNNVVIGDIQYNTNNQLTITFQASVSGKAYIN